MRWLIARRPMCFDLALLLLRLMMAAVFIYHGSQKLFGAFEGPGMEGWTGFVGQLGAPVAPVAAWASALTEFVGGILVGIGLFTRLAAIPMVLNMLVAIGMVHIGAFTLDKNGMEYALTLAVVLTSLIIVGPGRWSVDGWINGECCKPVVRP